jgi:ubiquinone/menaquinone biosynthesis C-methylase UbiE
MIKQDIIESIIKKNGAALGDNNIKFISRVFDKGILPYKERLLAYGFCNHENVLDAGCGFGQWSLALADLNNNVLAVDISEKRISFLNELINHHSFHNIRTDVSELTSINAEDNYFDIIFCYGVLFLTPWKESLAELVRVLKKGGKIYINANGFGWYKNLWYNSPNKADDYDPSLLAAKVLYNTWNYKNGKGVEPGLDILIEPEELSAELEALGLSEIKTAAEGRLRADGFIGKEPQAFFNGEYLGDLGVYEVIAVKK